MCACYLQTAILPPPRQHLQQRRPILVQAKEVREHHTVHGCQLTPTCTHAHTHTHTHTIRQENYGSSSHVCISKHLTCPNTNSLLSYKYCLFVCLFLKDNIKVLKEKQWFYLWFYLYVFKKNEKCLTVCLKVEGDQLTADITSKTNY